MNNAVASLPTPIGHVVEVLGPMNVRKYGTVFNTIAPGMQLSGMLRRK
jgi:acyl CoA:acetate/3-ketoacid CoA transferase beta subunit